MKILFQLPLKMDLGNPAFGPFVNLMLRRFAKVKRPETELIPNPCNGLSDFEDYAQLGLRFMNDSDLLKSILEAKTEDTDGVIISCFFDPALWAARQMLDIPVTGLAESSFHLASLMGRKFAVIASDRRYVAPLEEIINAYAMRGMAIDHNPVRAIDMSEMVFLGCLAQGDLTPLTERVKQVGKSCIEDGADALILGCGIMSVLVTEGAGFESIDGVPFLDPDVASIKLIEMLVDIAKTGLPIKSKAGMYWSQ